MCGRPAAETAADVPLCRHHYERILGWHHAQPARDHEARLQRQREHYQEQDRLEEDRLRAQEEARVALSVVYYAQRASDALIKIGTTRCFAQRMTALRVEHGEVRPLLTHSGDHKREHEMHARFARLRVEGEWFRPAPPLMDWIVTTRRSYTHGGSQLRGVVGLREVIRLARGPISHPVIRRAAACARTQRRPWEPISAKETGTMADNPNDRAPASGPFETEVQALDLPAVRAIYDATMRQALRDAIGYCELKAAGPGGEFLEQIWLYRSLASELGIELGKDSP
jgi:hypothetical protein